MFEKSLVPKLFLMILFRLSIARKREQLLYADVNFQ